MTQLPSNHLTTYVRSKPLEELRSDREVTLALQRKGYEWIEHEHILILGKELPEIDNGILLVMKPLQAPKDELSEWSIRLEEDVGRAEPHDPNKTVVTQELKDLFDLNQARFSTGLKCYSARYIDETGE